MDLILSHCGGKREIFIAIPGGHAVIKHRNRASVASQVGCIGDGKLRVQ